ncbi:hypothetical protein B0T26DRAFT_163022 [Lasiosphaeria miniovina]|uniref:Uncharacterized protein n=1 Tax=Lasiosphaeria miniovina TaxID=1954250 RepID=A0AA40B606_9PEZI|nr:uncharacterized protein B0T26DRAFT_163022 [Lasiosphaeria miniovina]KAK0728199.1 hypothetical protein B0T26DRAFT_163022 [Lasiosphaeria miniovina]
MANWQCVSLCLGGRQWNKASGAAVVSARGHSSAACIEASPRSSGFSAQEGPGICSACVRAIEPAARDSPVGLGSKGCAPPFLHTRKRKPLRPFVLCRLLEPRAQTRRLFPQPGSLPAQDPPPRLMHIARSNADRLMYTVESPRKAPMRPRALEHHHQTGSLLRKCPPNKPTRRGGPFRVSANTHQ